MKKEIATFAVNGMFYEELIESNMTLLELLRDRLGLAGTKQGCAASGNCGACTVLVDGKPMLSCVTLAWTVRGQNMLTIEGLAKGNALHPMVKEAKRDGTGVFCY